MASSAGWVNGLLTGNTPVRARAKLESASIWSAFDSDFAYFGNEALSRGALVPSSVRAIRSEGCSVGRDRDWRHPRGCPERSRSAKLQVVAVATRPYSAAELAGLGPDLLSNDCESGRSSLVDFMDSLKSLSCCPKCSDNGSTRLVECSIERLHRAIGFSAALLQTQQLCLSVELRCHGSYFTKTPLSLHSPVLEVDHEVAMPNGG